GIEELMKSFLWSQGDTGRGKSKVVWEVESLWVKWIQAYKLKGRNFWDYPLRGNMSWGWRKILQDLLLNGSWTWSVEWYMKYPLLATYAASTLVCNSLDRLIWKTQYDVDKEFFGKPLKKVDSLCNHDSEDELASVDNEMASFFASKKNYLKIYAGLPTVAASLDSCSSHSYL
nr:hypothetical protein [Tanacetum cinerariifolium]